MKKTTIKLHNTFDDLFELQPKKEDKTKPIIGRYVSNNEYEMARLNTYIKEAPNAES